MTLSQWIIVGAFIVLIATAAAVALIILLSDRRQEPESTERINLLLWNDRNNFLLQIPVGNQVVLGRKNLYQYLQEPITIPMDITISREHVCLAANGGQIWMWNLSRTNPATINGKQSGEGVPLAQGDRLRMGNSSFVVMRIE